MSDARRPIPFLALAFLLVASAVERSAYFSGRMLLSLTLRQEQSLSFAEIGWAYTVLHERARALAVGLWLLVTSRSAILTGLLGPGAGTVGFAIVGITCSVVGLLIAVRAGRLHEACFARMPAAPSHPI
jgi:hypothetical protein